MPLLWKLPVTIPGASTFTSILRRPRLQLIRLRHHHLAVRQVSQRQEARQANRRREVRQVNQRREARQARAAVRRVNRPQRARQSRRIRII